MPERIQQAAEHLADQVAKLRADLKAEATTRAQESAQRDEETRVLRNRNRLLGAILAVAIVVGGAVFLDYRDNTHRRDEEVGRLCDSVTKNRDLLDAVVHVAYEPTGGGGLDLAAVPSYAGLPPDVRAWVDELNARLNPPASGHADPRDADGDGIPDAISVLLAEVTC